MRRTYQAGDEPVTGYTLRRSLGRGSLGEVWETAGPGGTVVAFKIIDLTEKGGLREFRSIRRMKRVRHPNLVPILAWWLRDDSGRLVEAEEADKAIDDPSYHPAELFIAMGLGDKSLQDRFKECKAQGHPGIPPGELVGYMEDVARAVDHLNSPKHDLGQGLVALHHGDIKPQNLLIVSGAAQLSDSGLARVLGQSSSGTTANVTLAFAPPEILEDTKATPTTDQYTLALTYYYLRTGSLPYSKPDNTTIITETLQGHLDFSRVSPAEQEVLEKAAARNPAQRYPTCMDMARELRRVVELLTSRPTGLVIEPGSELLPGYKLIRNIGRGAFGEVWEASAPGNKRLAIKIIKDLDRTPARLQQELKALDLMQKVVHSHLLELKGCWLLDRKGHSFTREAVNKPGHLPPAVLLLATKLAETSLSKVFEDYKNRGHNGVPIRELLGWLKQAAEALDHLNAPRHQVEGQRVSLQHRNVKPENLLLLENQVYLTDFHMVKPVGGQEVSAEIHQDSVGFTFHYSAPEVLRGRVTKWSDEFSLAMTYCHLRTGELPFERSGSSFDMMMRQMEGKWDLRLLPEAERRVVAKALSVNPEDRFPNSLAFITALETAAGVVPSGPIQPPSPPQPPPPQPPQQPPNTSKQTTKQSSKETLSKKEPPAPKPPPSEVRDPIKGGSAPRFNLPGYRLVTQRGKGGFGQVWEAIGPGNVPVALKFIEMDHKNAVKAEVRALEMMKRIRHPHILSIFGAWEHERYMVIALELAEKSLSDRLKELQAQGQKGLPLEELIPHMEDAAKGIDFLNEPRHDLGGNKGQSIQHRDIKPHNLLLIGGAVKVADFGLAKMLEKSVGGHSGAMSVAYAAPEFFNEQTSNSSDQYSLAITYCQLRGGRLPFAGTEAKIMRGHLQDAPDLSMLPTEAERKVVARALAKNPKERFANCGEFVRALRKSQRGGEPKPPSTPPAPKPATAPPTTTTPRPVASVPTRRKSSHVLATFLILLMLGLVGALLFLLVQAFKPKPK